MKKAGIPVYFVIGKMNLHTPEAKTIWESINNDEADQFQDILICDVYESYRSLSRKTFEILKFFENLNDTAQIDGRTKLLIINTDYRIV